MRSDRLFVIALVTSLMGGCAALHRGTQRGAELDRLQGIWEICFVRRATPDHPNHSDFSAGYISLTPMKDPVRSWMHLGPPTHYGVYTVDVARISITRDPRIPLPLVGARVTSDSLYLVLDPFGSHGPIIVRGQMGPNNASGIWFHHAYAFGAEGSFSMKHLATHTLPIPYPVGGPLTSPAIAGCADG